ncbi:beta-glucosidase [Leeuwenhoekiella parthenopeia]|uniref:Glycoside hydrolase family 3 C-terminal domain-containing protein n=1 Tax=Leeuwenhoekiella parthenopeia TaxID=2890320 RepID=A0ABS8GSL0_9FLAO|nr:glycoside hydrolase family 3 C-terminal domain-containing protein [Leeuwenhoekiella parthenopeia]MCC4212987.1 glycoside hydrolase family 3 C-terminal domain-containing protein [Leeuwenhoekiella parthenopeia]
MKKHLLYLLLLSCAALSAQKNTQELIDELTLDEKIYFLIGTGMEVPGLPEDSKPAMAVVGATKNEVAGAAGTSYAVPRLAIPAVVFADGPAGIRISPQRDTNPGQTFYATAFPTASSLSSTWNTGLAAQVGEAFGIEGRDYGVDFLLAPALNIHRNPLGGRNFEYYSEDPVLGGMITAGFVNGVQATGLGATIKHFVANNSETNRTALNTVVSERALREIYLRGFKIALDHSDPWAVMSSYNKINGTYASENEELLTQLLREEWGYQGFVMTDWFAGTDAVAQVKAGNDLLMPGTGAQFKALKAAVEAGELDEAIIDRNLTAILNTYQKTFAFKGYEPSGITDLEGHKAIARQAATEGMVLLKNEKESLPLVTGRKVALFGSASYETIAGGTGSGDVNKAYSISVLEGLKAANVKLDEQLLSDYEIYMKAERAKIPPKALFFLKDELVPEKSFSAAELNKLAETNDVAVFTLGRTSGEFQDRAEADDFLLTETEKELLTNLKRAFSGPGKSLVVVLNIGGVIETEFLKETADAILLAWQPGQEGGNAIADVLTGTVNPSGKLPVTFPVQLADVASSKNFPGSVLDPDAEKPANPLQGVPSEEIYEEGIYVGYRYFDSFEVPVSYPFGYGLSYTSFAYADLKVTETAEGVQLQFSITNTGKTAGKEIAQVYVAAPQTGLEKPAKELKAFAKTDLLNPAESETVTLTINRGDLASYDDEAHAWILEAGDYTFNIAASVTDLKLQTTVNQPEKVLRKTKALLTPKVSIPVFSKN